MSANPVNEPELLVALESVKLKSSLALPSLFLMTALSITVAAILWDEIPIVNIALWTVPVLLALFSRYYLAQRISTGINTYNLGQLRKADLKLRISSLVTQSLVGSGIWTVGALGPPEITFLVTALICLFTAGIMANLASDYFTFAASLTVLLVQPFIYWLTQGLDNIIYPLAILSIFLLALNVVRFSERLFKESITVRFEKNQILATLETEKTKTEAALAEAKVANRTKAFFMAAASHDLRQPLFVISMLNETLQLHDLPEYAQEILRKQGNSIEAMRHLFESLLDLSQFETGEIQQHITSFELKNLLVVINEEFDILCQKKNLEWHCTELSTTIRSDYDLVSRVLRNLLNNAVKYTESGSVRLTAKVDAGQLVLSVHDTGIGISEDNQKKIFDEFVQLHEDEGQTKEGVGLGLAIVKQIDNLLDLKLTMKSARSPNSHGTSFSFRLNLESETGSKESDNT